MTAFPADTFPANARKNVMPHVIVPTASPTPETAIKPDNPNHHSYEGVNRQAEDDYLPKQFHSASSRQQKDGSLRPFPVFSSACFRSKSETNPKKFVI
jgi:hypothetical protein